MFPSYLGIFLFDIIPKGLPSWLIGNLPANTGDAYSIPASDPLEEEMVTHSRILVWRIPWTEEPGALQLMGLQRVRHD